jgi:hypothetical protein
MLDGSEEIESYLNKGEVERLIEIKKPRRVMKKHESFPNLSKFENIREASTEWL